MLVSGNWNLSKTAVNSLSKTVVCVCYLFFRWLVLCFGIALNRIGGGLDCCWFSWCVFRFSFGIRRFLRSYIFWLRLRFFRCGCFLFCLGFSLALFAILRRSFFDVLLFGTDKVALDVIKPRVSLFRIFRGLFFLLLLFVCFVVSLIWKL